MHEDERNKDITTTFIALDGNMPHLVEEHHIDILEYYVKRLYSPKSKELRLTLAAERLAKFVGKADNVLRKLPMSRPGLIEHTKRACYQSGFLWRECMDNVNLPDPTRWGWTMAGNILVLKWQNMEALDVMHLISSCTCKSNSCKSCKCSRNKWECLLFCSCNRSCDKNNSSAFG